MAPEARANIMNELDTTPRVVRTGGLLIAGDGKRGSDTLLPFAFSVMLFAAWYFPFTSVADFVGFKADDAVYLLMADDYSPFRPAEPVLDYVRRMSHLPPLYPALLGWLGAGSGEVDVAHLIQTTCLLSSLFTLGLLTARLTADRPTALMLMWLFAISPATVFLSTEIWSEFLYLTLANAALALVVFSQRQHSLWYAVALLAGLSTITRGIGLLLIIALATNLFARKVPKRWLIIFLALVPMVAMELWQFGGGSEYFDIYQKKRVTEAIGMIAQIHATVLAVWSGWLSLFDPTPRYPTVVIAALALPLAVVGGWPRLRSFEVDALYAAGLPRCAHAVAVPRGRRAHSVPIGAVAVHLCAAGMSSVAPLPHARCVAKRTAHPHRGTFSLDVTERGHARAALSGGSAAARARRLPQQSVLARPGRPRRGRRRSGGESSDGPDHARGEPAGARHRLHLRA